MEGPWQPSISTYRPQDPEAEFESWRLPVAYLFEGEHPDKPARRVMRDRLRIPLSKDLRHSSTATTERFYARIRTERAWDDLERLWEAPTVRVNSP